MGSFSYNGEACKLLFLDFDGVMHPVDQRSLFCREEHLARVLGDFPTVEIVISSNWRTTHSLKTLQSFFLTGLRAKVIAVTPIFTIGSADTSAVPGARYQEIKQFLAASGDPGRPWVALDDDADIFPPGCSNLILCDSKHGFGNVAERTLRAALTARQI